MCSKRNGAIGVHCHRAMNWPIPVASTELWASCEPLRRHVLKIGRPYIRRDVYRFEIPPNRHVIPTLEILISRSFFSFFMLHTKNHAKIRFWNINFFLKKSCIVFYVTYVATQFFTHVLINFQKNSKIEKNNENPKKNI